MPAAQKWTSSSRSSDEGAAIGASGSCRVFLVTGGSGVVGSAIVPLLLAEADTRVHLLLRAGSEEELPTRIGELAAYWGDAVDANALATRLSAVRGDVTRQDLGLAARDRARLAGEVTHIIHSAGNVKLNQSIESARSSAVAAVESMLAFARECRGSSTPPKIEYLSTVGVAGRRPGLIPEAPLGEQFGFHNTYEQAKAEAESLVLRAVAAGQPVTVHRPSMVVGDSRSGRVMHFQVFYHLIRFLAGMRTRGILPRFGDARLDLVPVDYVARAVVASTRRSDSSGRILHLCSGPKDATPLATMAGWLRQYLVGRGEHVRPLRFVPRTLLRVAVSAVSRLGSVQIRRGYETLPFFLDYLDEAQVFASAQTAEYLQGDGIAMPAVSEFLRPILDYWYTSTSSRASR